MSRALVTHATASYAELAAIAMPSFEDFADAHGYELVVADVDSDRPPSWWKIPALQNALVEFDEALWVDADVVIVDVSEDVPVADGAWQALVEHHTDDGAVPNLGVWFVRREMLPVLERAWAMTQFLEHPWWEQAAVVSLMGYDWTGNAPPVRLVERTPLYDATCFLELGWNVHKNDCRVPVRERFMHATMHEDRASVMREWAGRATVAALAAPGGERGPS